MKESKVCCLGTDRASAIDTNRWSLLQLKGSNCLSNARSNLIFNTGREILLTGRTKETRDTRWFGSVIKEETARGPHVMSLESSQYQRRRRNVPLTTRSLWLLLQLMLSCGVEKYSTWLLCSVSTKGLLSVIFSRTYMQEWDNLPECRVLRQEEWKYDLSGSNMLKQTCVIESTLEHEARMSQEMRAIQLWSCECGMTSWSGDSM